MAKRRRQDRDTMPKGKKLVELFLKNRELIEGTERGYKDVEEGRVIRLADLKKELGDI